ncbi:cytochrome o ubiquinol oxidase subunit I, partial [Candidatus Aerophobetes bacterium]
MWGRLNLSALSQDWIENMAGVGMGLGAIAILAVITYHKRWTWLWKEWITTTDHKKIGIMYIIVSIVIFVKGLVDGLMMRAQQAVAVGDNMGYLGADHFQQIFTSHGVAMIFFVGMGVVFGLINLLMPLQIGARDV